MAEQSLLSVFLTKGRKALINSIQLQRKETQSAQQKSEKQRKNVLVTDFV